MYFRIKKENIIKTTTENSSADHYQYKIHQNQRESVRPTINTNSDSTVCRKTKYITPYKFYIYDLPPKFNNDLVKAIKDNKMLNHCFELDSNGMGPELFKYGDPKQLSIRNTHQFSLEVIIHNKLKLSPYRTLKPDKADIFYIPAYIGLACILYHGNQSNKVINVIKQLLTFLTQFPYYSEKRPHFITTGKIQREMASENCPFLTHPAMNKANLTVIAIEKEQTTSWLKYNHLWNLSLITAPYPSYVHFRQTDNSLNDYESNTLKFPPLEERNVFIFLAAGRRTTNKYRTAIMNQFPIVTREGYNSFKFLNASQEENETMVKLQTDECDPHHKWTTITWMQHSVFCLQPPGDSPTRKSFFDSVLSGCIPVLFLYPSEHNPYPFQSYFDYDKFTIKVPYRYIVEEKGKILNFLQAIAAKEIKVKHDKLKEIFQWFQYSMLPDKTDQDIMPQKDATEIILKSLADIYHFKQKSVNQTSNLKNL